jgi:hypothetical protein
LTQPPEELVEAILSEELAPLPINGGKKSGPAAPGVRQEPSRALVDDIGHDE